MTQNEEAAVAVESILNGMVKLEFLKQEGRDRAAALLDEAMGECVHKATMNPAESAAADPNHTIADVCLRLCTYLYEQPKERS